MEKDFFTALKKNCNIHGIDIDVIHDNVGVECDDEILLIYNGTTFEVTFIEDNGKLEVNVSITNMSIKGKDYNYDTYSFVDKYLLDDTYDTVNDAVEQVIDIVINSDDRRKLLKIINSFESFIEDMEQDDLDILLSYIENKYD
jgi:hypothetical protein